MSVIDENQPNEVQRTAMLMQQIDVLKNGLQRAMNQIDKLTKFYGNPGAMKRTIVGSEFVNVYNEGDKTIVSIDEDALREDNPPLPTGLNLPICESGQESQELGASGEGVDAIDADTWVNDGTIGVVKWEVTRILYDHTVSSPELVMFQHASYYDRNGNLCAVGAEVRTVVDTPEECVP